MPYTPAPIREARRRVAAHYSDVAREVGLNKFHIIPRGSCACGPDEWFMIAEGKTPMPFLPTEDYCDAISDEIVHLIKKFAAPEHSGIEH